eukprot:CAMPEP_0118991488 /NCGR_PEP_ID=MMETSP1173-20130426/51703_1 /TAXON_ID=1034831 /ORGANISM="Rhizochromulina marina cf, Strain CCMP1243" /LENGTH=255 /DNA_ID=CAMNT_0006942613 /DNA_START=45 /DNA_END=808 /DNA_ORIENTATION=-
MTSWLRRSSLFREGEPGGVEAGASLTAEEDPVEALLAALPEEDRALARQWADEVEQGLLVPYAGMTRRSSSPGLAAAASGAAGGDGKAGRRAGGGASPATPSRFRDALPRDLRALEAPLRLAPVFQVVASGLEWEDLFRLQELSALDDKEFMNYEPPLRGLLRTFLLRPLQVLRDAELLALVKKLLESQTRELSTRAELQKAREDAIRADDPGQTLSTKAHVVAKHLACMAAQRACFQVCQEILAALAKLATTLG